MNKTIAGLIVAIGSIAPMAAAQAAVTPDEVDRATNASSFAELVPNAPAMLKAAAEQRAATAKDGQVQVAQYYGYGYYHPHYGYGYGYGHPHYGYGYGGYGGYGYGGYGYGHPGYGYGYGYGNPGYGYGYGYGYHPYGY